MTAPAGTTPSTDSGTPAEPTSPATGDDDELGDAGKAALKAERARANAAEKANRELAAKVQQFEDAGKSEADKIASRLAEVERREVAALKRDVAEAKGIPASWAARLNGTTQAELEADAVELAKTLPAPTAPPTVPAGTKPAEALPGGSNPAAPVALNDDPFLKAIIAKVGPSRA